MGNASLLSASAASQTEQRGLRATGFTLLAEPEQTTNQVETSALAFYSTGSHKHPLEGKGEKPRKSAQLGAGAVSQHFKPPPPWNTHIRVLVRVLATPLCSSLVTGLGCSEQRPRYWRCCHPCGETQTEFLCGFLPGPNQLLLPTDQRTRGCSSSSKHQQTQVLSCNLTWAQSGSQLLHFVVMN